MFWRILVFCLLIAVNPLAAGVIYTAASGSVGPFDATGYTTVVNAPLSSMIASSYSSSTLLGGGFDLLFPAISVPAGNTVTQLVLWVMATYASWSPSGGSVTPVVATCSDGPCPFHAARFGGFPGGAYGWGTSINISGIYWFSSNFGGTSTFVDVSHNTDVVSAVAGGTPLLLHAGARTEYEGPGELTLDPGYNAITQLAFHVSGSPGLWAGLEVHFEETVPEPGTCVMFCLALVVTGGWLHRVRRRDAAAHPSRERI